MRPTSICRGHVAIRIRQVDGVTIALCAVESNPQPGDLYLDDGAHYALAAKFMEDWKGETSTGGDVEYVRLMETQKVRDASEEMNKWQAAANAFRAAHPEVGEFGWREVKPYWETLFGSYDRPDAT